MIELEQLLAGIPGDDPCGPDLEYDPAFAELATKSRGEPERSMGDATKAAVPPDWLFVQENAQALLRDRSKDLRVAVLLVRAFTRTSGAEGLLAGLTVVKELLARYWEGVHPRPDPDTGDPMMRLNAIAGLAELDQPESLIVDVRMMYLVRPSKQGQLTLRELLAVAGRPEGGATEAGQSHSEVTGILLAARAESTAAVEALRQTVKVAADIQSTYAEKLAADQAARPDAQGLQDSQAPSLNELTKMLKTATSFADGVLGIGVDGEGAEGDGSTSGGGFGGNSLRSRDDAARLIVKLCEFIERTEPTNPAPLLLRRAGRLMNKNFIEIIKDLTPDSMSQIENIIGPDGNQ